MNENNDSINKAKMAAEKAKEYAEKARLEEERENREQREKARKNMPLVSPRRVQPEAGRANSRNPRKVKKSAQSPSGAIRRVSVEGQSDGQAGRHQQTPNSPEKRLHHAQPTEVYQRKQAMRMAAGRRLQEEQQYYDDSEFQQNYQADDYDIADSYAEDDELSRNLFGYIIAVLVVLFSLAISGAMWIVNILPTTPRLIVTGTTLLLSAIVFILAAKGQASKKTRRVGGVLGTLFLIVLALISYFLFRGIGFLSSLHTSKENVLFEVRVLQDSPLQSLADLDQRQIGVSGTEDDDDILKAIDSISKTNGVHVESASYDNYVALVDSLYSGESQVILFNSAKLEVMKDAYPDFEKETRVLGTAIVEIEISDLVIPVNTSREPFNIYISGIDTYGEISTVSRSDVNIIMTVDPANKQILLTSIPRDTYVPIYNTAGSDKLTHAGIYGIESSIGTLSQFLNTDINYFVRVNFSSLIELVDVLGGVELDNPEEFVTRDGNGNYYFPKGKITLNGDEALAFSRERYNIAEGDIGRGKNQMRVIEAMINKAISPEIITHADELMKRFNEVAETNMPAKDMSNLVNAQLSNNQSWSFETLTLNGTGRNDLPSQAMPGYALYMYDPDPDSLKEIQDRISEMLKK